MKNFWIILVMISSVFGGKIKVVTSTTDLADIVSQIGGDRVTVSSIARGNQDPHYVEVLPSYMIKVKRAHIYFMVGMELDLWAEQIIDGSRNRHLIIVDCSKDIEPMEVPTGDVDASMGDIHRFGNPHYWLDPLNGKIIAKTIKDALITQDPKSSVEYEQRYQTFIESIDNLLVGLKKQSEELHGKKVIFYHNSWPYFTRQFGLKTMAFVEPKPGITPSPGHLEKLIRTIESEDVLLMGIESYFSENAVEFLEEKTGVPYVKLSQSVGALSEADSYQNLFRVNLNALMSNL